MLKNEFWKLYFCRYCSYTCRSGVNTSSCHLPVESDEDDDDSFLVSSKNQDVPVDENFDPDQPKLSKKKMMKRITKEDVAQKLMKKNIKVNTVTTFDDEGNVAMDPKKVQVRFISLCILIMCHKY